MENPRRKRDRYKGGFQGESIADVGRSKPAPPDPEYSGVVEDGPTETECGLVEIDRKKGLWKFFFYRKKGTGTATGIKSAGWLAINLLNAVGKLTAVVVFSIVVLSQLIIWLNTGDYNLLKGLNLVLTWLANLIWQR